MTLDWYPGWKSPGRDKDNNLADLLRHKEAEDQKIQAKLEQELERYKQTTAATTAEATAEAHAANQLLQAKLQRQEQHYEQQLLHMEQVTESRVQHAMRANATTQHQLLTAKQQLEAHQAQLSNHDYQHHRAQERMAEQLLAAEHRERIACQAESAQAKQLVNTKAAMTHEVQQAIWAEDRAAKQLNELQEHAQQLQATASSHTHTTTAAWHEYQRLQQHCEQLSLANRQLHTEKDELQSSANEHLANLTYELRCSHAEGHISYELLEHQMTQYREDYESRHDALTIWQNDQTDYLCTEQASLRRQEQLLNEESLIQQ